MEEEEKIPDWLMDVWNKVKEIQTINEKNKGLTSMCFGVGDKKSYGTVKLVNGYFIQIELSILVNENLLNRLRYRVFK